VPNRPSGARYGYQSRPRLCAVPAGQVVLAQLAALQRADWILHGLSDACQPADSLIQRVHGGMDTRPVPATPGSARHAEAVVLGDIPCLIGALSPHGVCQRLYLPRHRLVQHGGAWSSGAGVAAPEVSAVLAPV